MAYFSEHHAQFFFILSALSFIIELAILGFGGPLLFFALASALTGILISVGVLSGWDIEILFTAISTAVIAAALWKPLKNFQNSGDGSDSSSDMIGREVPVSAEINAHTGSIRYSGINWNSRLADDSSTESIAEGEQCIIAAVDGNVMLVKPLESA